MNLEEYITKRVENLENENDYLKDMFEKAEEKRKYWFEKYIKLQQEIERFAEYDCKIRRYSTGEIAFAEATFTKERTPIAISILEDSCKERKQNEESKI